MREILFRGKRFDGIWQTGYYFEKPILNRAFILLGEEQWEVDPNTVGQYTGLTDKNGVKIFEGDIFPHPDDPKDIYVVSWDEDGGFTIFTDDTGFDPKGIQIIGNIHDNQELL